MNRLIPLIIIILIFGCSSETAESSKDQQQAIDKSVEVISSIDHLHLHRKVRIPDLNLEQFLAKGIAQPDGNASKIYILPIGEFTGEDLESFNKQLKLVRQFFQLDVVMLEDINIEGLKHLDVETRWNNDSGDQILTSSIIDKYVVPNKPDDAFVILGISSYDIYGAGYNWLYGSSQSEKRAGIISSYRINPKSENGDLRLARLMVKQITNLFGINNVKSWVSVMNYANSPTELDQKPIFLDPLALVKLQSCIGFELQARNDSLQAYWNEQGVASLAKYYEECNKALNGQEANYSFNYKSLLSKNISSFPNTKLIPTWKMKTDPNLNNIYCGTFQLAWNKLQSTFVDQTISMNDGPAWVDYLNESQFSEFDIDTADCLTFFSAFDENARNQLVAEMNRKFPGHMEFPTSDTANSVYAFAYLLKNLSYEQFHNQEKIYFNKKQWVQAFGFEKYENSNDKISEEVSLMHYDSDDDFTIKINLMDSKDELLVSKMSPSQSLHDTYGEMRAKLRGEKIELQPGDLVQIPYLTFDITAGFDEILNKYVGTYGHPANPDLRIERMLQRVRFEMDEDGIDLESMALVEVMEDAMEEPEEDVYIPKKLIFNSGYLVSLRKAGSKEPYFLMWVNNTELMQLR
jgi:predicted Zn-dependent protease